MKKIWPKLITAIKGYLVLAGLGLLPILPTLILAPLADQLGCAMHEGFASQCIFLGRDIGELLYSAAVWPWFLLLSVPAAAMGAVIWTGVVVVGFFRKR